ncbi:hypothetical protein BH09VER1_BH09VER1_29070 [soil metagenome]
MSESSQTPFIPDHEVLRVIGRGAYGQIWLARSLTGMWRAVKVISRSNFASERSFQREFDGMASFEPISRSHEGFVDILHVGKGEGFFYYIMELADDLQSAAAFDESTYQPKTLKSVLDLRGRLPARECIEFGISLTTALQALHERGLTHRDIKPSNIIFVHGVPKIADIGLVAVSGQESFVGTEGYVPPEGPGSPQADIYSLGKVFYEITMGKDRLDFPDIPTTLEHLDDKHHVLELNEILLKACAAKLKRRYATAEEMHGDLVMLKHGQRKRSLMPWLAAAVILLLAAGGWAALSQKPKPPVAPPVSTGSVTVVTEPTGAMVVLEGQLKNSPAVFAKLEAGRHQAHIMMNGYEAADAVVEVQAGTNNAAPAVVLLRLVGALKISSDPDGAAFSVLSGTTVIREGTAPATLKDLPEGDYEVLGKNSGATVSETVSIEPNQTAEKMLTFLPGNGSVKITSSPGGATVFQNGQEIGRTPTSLEDLPPGEITCELRLTGFKARSVTGRVESQRCTLLAARLERNSTQDPTKQWTNSLGMVFSVPIDGVRFGIWETRVRDYAAYCQATGQTLPHPDFDQTEDDPVVMVNRADAMAFCQWLTEKERKEGLIGDNQSYRLPTDPEWSQAAGLPSEGGETPEARDGKVHGIYAWGTTWPPPTGAGNLADQSLRKSKNNPFIANYNDGWAQTAPVGKFNPNANGLFDMGGNVWEWCLEDYKGEDASHIWGVLRGGSWATVKRSELELSYRNVADRSYRDIEYGFRCVLVGEE